MQGLYRIRICRAVTLRSYSQRRNQHGARQHHYIQQPWHFDTGGELLEVASIAK